MEKVKKRHRGVNVGRGYEDYVIKTLKTEQEIKEKTGSLDKKRDF